MYERLLMDGNSVIFMVVAQTTVFLLVLIHYWIIILTFDFFAHVMLIIRDSITHMLLQSERSPLLFSLWQRMNGRFWERGVTCIFFFKLIRLLRFEKGGRKAQWNLSKRCGLGWACMGASVPKNGNNRPLSLSLSLLLENFFPSCVSFLHCAVLLVSWIMSSAGCYRVKVNKMK